MGKDKSEKKDKSSKKEKRSETDGVKKPKKEKKSKLNDGNVAAALAETLNTEKEVAPAVVESKMLLTTDTSGETVVKPIGALVPFAAPLADEKVAKKVLKSVKKGTCLCLALSHPRIKNSILPRQRKYLPKYDHTNTISPKQLPKTKPSNAVSKKSSNRSVNPHQAQRAAPQRPVS